MFCVFPLTGAPSSSSTSSSRQNSVSSDGFETVTRKAPKQQNDNDPDPHDDDPANYEAREDGLYFHSPGQAHWERVQRWTSKFYLNHVQGKLQSRTNYMLEHNTPNTVLPLESLVTMHRQGNKQQITGTQQ